MLRRIHTTTDDASIAESGYVAEGRFELTNRGDPDRTIDIDGVGAGRALHQPPDVKRALSHGTHMR